MMAEVHLDRTVVEAIETGLNAGYDIEVRKNRYGITVASVGKKLIYKDNPIQETIPKREGTK